MAGKQNQVIAVARFLLYKSELNKRLERMSDEEYLKNPIGLEIGKYVEDLMKYCPEDTVDKVLCNQTGLIARLGEEYLTVLANMPYEKGMTKVCMTEGRTPIYGVTSSPV